VCVAVPSKIDFILRILPAEVNRPGQKGGRQPYWY
jgi:hypothetical protein